MKAYEFPAKVTDGGKLEFPEAILKQLPTNQEVRVTALCAVMRYSSNNEQTNFLNVED